jgi:hypothetical protein
MRSRNIIVIRLLEKGLFVSYGAIQRQGKKKNKGGKMELSEIIYKIIISILIIFIGYLSWLLTREEKVKKKEKNCLTCKYFSEFKCGILDPGRVGIGRCLYCRSNYYLYGIVGELNVCKFWRKKAPKEEEIT